MVGYFGFIFSVDLYEGKEKDDGAGGIAKKLRLTTPDVVCRICAMSSEEQREIYGDVSPERFILITTGSNELDENTYVVQSLHCQSSPLRTGGVYKVIQPGRRRYEMSQAVHHTVTHIEYHDDHTIH
jgi:hypothetical protein